MKKILIFYASYGGGHLSAAKSINNYLYENYPDIQTELVDCMKYINAVLEKLTTGAYREMAKKAPKLWKEVYDHSQRGLLSKISKNSNKLMARKLAKLILESSPDLILSTHPFSSQMVSYLKKKGELNCKLATILTDFEIHEQWIVGHEYTDLYFVSNEHMKDELIEHSIPASQIFVTGIPFSNRFLQNFDRKNIFKMFNLDINKKVALFFGGGEFGLGKDKTVQILKDLISVANDFQIVSIAGKNEKMKLAFEEVLSDMNVENRVRVLPFTDKVPELMSISSVVITKPGGLTTTESLVSNLPIIVINPLPGQEEENALFLEKNNVGVWIRKDDNPEVILSQIFNSPNKLAEMKEHTKLLAKPNSTKQICDTLVNIL